MNLITDGLGGLALITDGLGVGVAPVIVHDYYAEPDITFEDKPSGISVEDKTGPIGFGDTETGFKDISVEFKDG